MNVRLWGRRILVLAGILPVLLPMPATRALADSGAPMWNFAWITDTQTPDCKRITALVTEVGENRPSMVIHTGDTRFEWANRCAWRDVVVLMHRQDPPVEFHLAPGNHDLDGGVLHRHLRRAAVDGLYRIDTGRLAPGQGYYQDRVTEYLSGPEWPRWNPEILQLPAWQTAATPPPGGDDGDRPSYRYIFRRGGIRFIVTDCYDSPEQRDWIRRLLVEPDESSITIILHHRNLIGEMAPWFEGLEGKHNVKLVLSGDDHHFRVEERFGVTFITGAGMARGPWGECDAMTMWVYPDHLRLDRHVLPPGEPLRPIEPPETIWECQGVFSEYRRPEPAAEGGTPRTPEPVAGSAEPKTIGADLLYNGDFENGVWYQRYRGWTPTGWYEWFVPPHAPEHVAEKSRPFSGTHYVRIHMWGLAWHGGILQTVRGIEPCHWYRLEGYGFFGPPGAPEPRERVGIDPLGTLTEQFSVDVTKHPAPPYDEAIGDNPRTPEKEGPGLPESIVWSPYESYYRWGRFSVEAEARSDVVTVYLACNPEQRPATRPIYEMNWDAFTLREIPWPAPRLIPAEAELTPDDRIDRVRVRVQSHLARTEVTWTTRLPAGASQVLYRTLDAKEDRLDPPATKQDGKAFPSGIYPLETPVVYERSATTHRIEIAPFSPPAAAVALEVVALSRCLVDRECRTLASIPVRVPLP